jgi:peroxiredoxin Q/BCP
LKAKEAPRTAELREGDKAPLFSLPDDEGNPFRLEDVLGASNVILYFYPKDDTPGCRAESKAFRDEMSLFYGLEATIVGVSTGTVQSKSAFKRKYALNFKLLADEDRKVTELYGALGFFSNNPKRVTFVIGKDGRIRKIISSPIAVSHVEAAKAALFQMRDEEGRGGARPTVAP